MSNKPREWWIEINPEHIGPYNSNRSKYDAYNFAPLHGDVPHVHVIEKSAYDEERERADRLEAERSEHVKMIDQLGNTVEKLKADFLNFVVKEREISAMLREALEFAEKWAQIYVSEKNLILLAELQNALAREKEMRGGGSK